MADNHALAQLYKAMLEEDIGLVAKIDNDGDVLFKHPEMGTFFFNLDAENDPEYMMLVFPGFYDAKQGVSAEKLINICNTLNGRCKAVKFSVRDNDDRDVTASVEMLVAGPNQMPTREHLAGIMKRTLSMIASGVKQFAELAKEAKGTTAV